VRPAPLDPRGGTVAAPKRPAGLPHPQRLGHHGPAGGRPGPPRATDLGRPPPGCLILSRPTGSDRPSHSLPILCGRPDPPVRCALPRPVLRDGLRSAGLSRRLSLVPAAADQLPRRGAGGRDRSPGIGVLVIDALMASLRAAASGSRESRALAVISARPGLERPRGRSISL
jgi:hypothetical protein